MSHVVDADKYISEGKIFFYTNLFCILINFADDGKSQPGCTDDECSHNFAIQVYVDQINGIAYSSFTCESLEELDGR